jgi:hypothetical protein
MEGHMASEKLNGQNRGIIGTCARPVTAECGLREPLECKIHHDIAAKKAAAESWKIAENRSR